MNKLYQGISIISASIILAGCGGGGGSDSTTSNSNSLSKSAQLIDAPIIGAKYVNEDGSTGKTVQDGTFNYTGGKVSFYIGQIKIGEINSLKDDNRVFLQDILNLQRDEKSDSKLLTSAQFLQSLDTDPSTDSIEIGSNFEKFDNDTYKNSDLKDLDVLTALKNNNIEIKELDDVKEHLDNSIKAYIKNNEDTNAPIIKSVSPQNDASEVLTNEDIIVEFSENISKESLLKSNVVLKDPLGNVVQTTKLVNKNQLVVKPSSTLNLNTKYTLELDKNIQDFAGNSLVSKKVVNFSTMSTKDTTAPYLWEMSPSANQEGFKISDDMVLKFSEKMNDDTINSANITLTKKDDANKIDLKIRHSNKIVTINPTVLLEPNTEYTLSISSNVTDANNNAYSARDINFTTNDTFSHNGFEYKIIQSPITGKHWLDRNLGATKVCEDKADEKCYGDYYQWGRLTNGHEKNSSEVFDASLNPLEKDVQSNGKFATWADDWRKNKNDDLWKGANAINAVCPTGYKVPSIDELLIETKHVNELQHPTQKVDGQYTNLTNFLKLPNNGFRHYISRTGHMDLRAYSGEIWSSTTNNVGLVNSLGFFPGGIYSTPVVRSFGKGVRCIKDYNDTVIPTVVSTTPQDNQTDVSIDTEFRVQFSKPFISSPSRSNILLLKDDKQIAVNILRNISNHSFVISPDKFQGDAGSGLSYDTEYKFVFKKDLYDVSGNTLAEDKVITFRTQKSPELRAATISKSLPKDNSTSFIRNENLRVTFSKELKVSTIDANIILKQGENVIASTKSYENRVVTINPTSSLDANTIYTIEVSTNLEDINNIKVAEKITSTFTTGETLAIEDTYGNIYKEITSPKTGKVWLDRNLGALKVCEDLNDNCNGDYFQWGRKANGHEKINAITSNIKLADDVQNNASFITSNDNRWSTKTDETLWNTDGANNVCPTGFIVPSSNDLENELEGFTRTNLFDNFLKISNNGRKHKNASMDGNSYSYFWTNTTTASNFGNAKAMKIQTLNAVIEDEALNSGLAIRCIKKD
ncbi:Ig-like domain-containing protein [Poseidonibacter lekithochrous]|uniref:Ig-like domain-containing protein n=1 Tax=Poseidonibacter lekithochrous TaxID=1904463 RepID=UPI0008FC5BC3|nr:Ig-like domain-containing protein [Poseidonibacter lekithochrous]QKJ22723.1 bacterial Ig-like domain-containing protein [Poseidonibacter lekithochrous]